MPVERPSRDRPHRALVTGASRGIGAAVARALARDGYDVVINCKRDVDAASRVAEEVRALGRKATVAAFDVADAAAAERAVEELLDPGIDVVVNNAGVVRDAPFPTTTPQAWADVVRTALDGFYNVTRPLVMPMVSRRWGRIVNVSSVSGLVGNRGQVGYSAAKAGLVGATKALAREVAKRNVTVNAVAPGLIDTDMIKGAPVDEILKHVPMRRLGRAEEVADLVAFLVSDRAAYITGQVIGITGGLA
jgi:3-oxoacyl-[acyl-carrier protein] reductase